MRLLKLNDLSPLTRTGEDEYIIDCYGTTKYYVYFVYSLHDIVYM